MKLIGVRQLFTEIENQTGLIIKTAFIISAIKPKSSPSFTGTTRTRQNIGNSIYELRL